MVRITGIIPGGKAEKAGLRAGDVLISVNGHPICDVLDYRFYLAESRVNITAEREGVNLEFHISKGEYDDIGLEFGTPLMDDKHSCENRCIFCFIDQLPGGLREPLYFKDDDSRLSFLHGNYITLTNLRESDIKRIIEMRISPVNISVHTTNPLLRVKMMRNRRAGEVLKYLPMLAEGGISLCCQIVLCRGVNDGAELERTMRDLEGLYPALISTSIVPAGLTKYRQRLFKLEPFSPDECARVIDTVNAFGDSCLEKYGTRLFYAADEFYVKSGREIPPSEFYGEFSQIENGVGMLADFGDAFSAEFRRLAEYAARFRGKRKVSVATGEAAYGQISSMARRVSEKLPGLEVAVYPIKNNFFGGQITVAGLLTCTDISEQLWGRELGDELLFPRTALRSEGDLFLDGKSPEDLSVSLGVPVRAVKNDGADFLSALIGIE